MQGPLLQQLEVAPPEAQASKNKQKTTRESEEISRGAGPTATASAGGATSTPLFFSKLQKNPKEYTIYSYRSTSLSAIALSIWHGSRTPA